MSKDKDTILIPPEKLQHGFDLCKKQMEMLIESSEILHNSKKYPISIALSVLAREESAKLELIFQHIALSSGIMKREWDSLSRGFVHENKLKNPVKFAVDFATHIGKDLFEEIQEFGLERGYDMPPANYEDYMKISEDDYQRLVSLNVIKKECFYLDWRDSSWKVFFNRSKEQLEALSLVELTGMKYLLYGFIIGNLQFMERDEKLQKELDVVKEKFNQTKNFWKTKEFKIKWMIALSVYKQYFRSQP